MNKYAVRYCEILAKTIIAEADTYEAAEEKVQAAVNDCRIVLDMEDYDECEIRPSLTFGKQAIPCRMSSKIDPLFYLLLTHLSDCYINC